MREPRRRAGRGVGAVAMLGLTATIALGTSPPESRRVARAARRQASVIAVRCARVSRTGARDAGRLSQWSPLGGRLDLDCPLHHGERLELQFPRDAPAALRRAPTLQARVVSETTKDVPAGRYAYGVRFSPRRRLDLDRLVYACLPGLALLLFMAGVVHVSVLKLANVTYFWYRPVANLYSLLICLYILSRFALSVFYRTPRNTGRRPSVTVVVACKNEEASIGRTLDCIYATEYPRHRLQVVAVNDGSTDDTLTEMHLARARHPGLEVIDFGRNLGKRQGMAAGARAARGEILVYVDSDSFLRKDTLEKIVQDFADPDVGGVCGHAYAHNARRNFLTRMQEVRYYVAFRVVKAAESLFGAVSCCSGCLAAYRRSYVMEILDDWLGQRFLGTQATFGDDRSLTNYMLRRYRVTYNAEAVCSTIVPEGYQQFFKQQLRWKKSWIRETLIASTFMWRRHPFAAFFFYLGAIFPLISPFVAYNAIVYPIFGPGDVSLLYIYGAALMSVLYGLYYLGRLRSGLWVYGIAFSFFYMFILVWQTYYALFTVRQNHWGTR